ncbi:MAG: hypothetical protein RLO81_11075 [Fulvivirga sp.]|uniref:hypothetical protein n=1 Tax=Fulvivirga sp. TaxID=1931237 RepID=UPI0032EC10BD
MKEALLKLTCILLCLIVVNCSSSDDANDPTPQLPEAGEVLGSVSNIEAKDLGNAGDASDLVISFSKPKELELIKEFRLFLVKESMSDQFDSLKSLTNSNYLIIQKTASTFTIKLPSEFLDIEGDIIKENTPYVIFVLSLAIDDSNLGGKLSKSSPVIELAQKNLVRTIARINAGSGGMDVDNDGNIYMADFGSSTSGNPWGTKVYKITPQGEVSIFADGFLGASGNDFDLEGNLIQSSIAAGTIHKVTPSGNVSTIASGLQAPVGVVVAPDGDMFICNCSGNSISKLTSDGVMSTFSSGGLFTCPNGIDMDSDGNLYVANFNNSILVKIEPNGKASNFATLPAQNNGHLLINDNYIYVISRSRHQIHRVSFTGQVSLFAGNGQRGIIDGSLSEASFSLPNDLAFSADGKYIYINDVDGSNPNGGVISPVAIRVIELVE